MNGKFDAKSSSHFHTWKPIRGNADRLEIGNASFMSDTI